MRELALFEGRRTSAGDRVGELLAGRYRVFRRLGAVALGLAVPLLTRRAGA